MAAGEESLSGRSLELSVAHVRRVPDEYRFFSCDGDDAAQIYSVKGTLLEQLLDSGLPHRSKGGQIFLDDLDLSNITLDLRLNSPYCSSLQFWARSLKRARANGNPSYVFKLVCSCPQPGHDGACDFQFDKSIKEKIEVREKSQGVFIIQGSPLSEMYEFGSLIEPIVAEALRLKFHLLPAELSGDTAFVKESGLADCKSGALHLTEVAGEHGIIARPAMGLFAAMPQSVQHVWLEIFAENEWRHADPFFLSALAKWGVIDQSDWPLSRSPALAMFPMPSRQEAFSPLISHNGEPLREKVIIWTALSLKRG